MNSSIWLRVYHHEISRRKRLYAEKPKAAYKLFKSNPKKLAEDCKDDNHVWVPASTLWIHDKQKASAVIDGFPRRGLREAAPYIEDNMRVMPQMCWNCIKTREYRTPLMSWSERQKNLAQHILTDKKKPRGRKGSDTMIEEYEDLC